MYTNWYFVGDPKQGVFESKLQAEVACRAAYPEESPDKRYARIFCKEFGFELGEELGPDGYTVAAYGFDFMGHFITNPYISECGRFTVLPGYYHLTEEQAKELVAMNEALK